jgi:ABC-type multidrug transport system fused ATPase/permease subunit
LDELSSAKPVLHVLSHFPGP